MMKLKGQLEIASMWIAQCKICGDECCSIDWTTENAAIFDLFERGWLVSKRFGEYMYTCYCPNCKSEWPK